ncbi:hypothetical protein B9T62_26065 [Paenibacillus donghaensis]|uniref:Uncharacterized protein n=1 Tax=Paenibacillus donghaensis TaxID=414771 RepID=A0A2Z2KDA7_9BACL|nr:hypothetical protein B9T62_26065 [Paenibacillus donghaensis]
MLLHHDYNIILLSNNHRYTSLDVSALFFSDSGYYNIFWCDLCIGHSLISYPIYPEMTQLRLLRVSLVYLYAGK